MGRIAEGMLFSLIFPYINAMVHELGVAEENVGKWSAAAVSMLSLLSLYEAQTLIWLITQECVLFVAGTISGPFFGHLGNRFGRRPVYLLSLLGWAAGSVLFGLARSLAGVILGRALCELCF
jgi:MFS family permease